jgi:twitching motility protein PilT
MPSLTMKEIMQAAVDQRASDIHLKTGNPPILRIDGALRRLDQYDLLSEDDITEYLKYIATEADIKKFEKVMELDSSYLFEGIARFRVNACRDDGDTRVVMRLIPMRILSLDELGLPPVLKKLCQLKNGLVLFTGPTGSGKSTSLAAMINEINETRHDHVITVEDPLEFIHQDKTGIVTQREVGHDTLSFANALRGALPGHHPDW